MKKAETLSFSRESLNRGEEAMQITETLQKGLSSVLALLLLAPSAQTVQAQSMSVVDLNMTVGKSLVIDYPVEIGRISTSSPEVVDAVPATSKEFLLHGKGHGAATVVVWAKNGARTMYNVTVEHNTDPIKRLLQDTFPSEDIKIQSARDSITLIGQVSSKEVADRAVAIATPMAKTVVSNLTIAAAPVEKQIVLKVKFAELNRTKVAQFGVNLLSTGALNTPGRVTTGQFPAPNAREVSGTIGGSLQGSTSDFTLSDALNIFAFRPDLNLGAVVRALQNEDVLQILAEPNLVTTNGKEASFLVGGEFPLPVLQGGGNAGAVTIQFREFGIRLTFNPQLTGNGTIRMYVKPEVSTIDLVNAVQISGFTIPALATRRMETNVELKLGQSFAVAGLIDDRVTDQMGRIPGLSSIPILGSIFKSRSERKTKSELVVIVTPEIIEPLDSTQKLPTPDFPREFMKQSDMRKQSKNESQGDSKTSPNLNASNTSTPAAAEQAQPSESGIWKSMKFWGGNKKSSSLQVEPKLQQTEPAPQKAESPSPQPAASAPSEPVSVSGSSDAVDTRPQIPTNGTEDNQETPPQAHDPQPVRIIEDLRPPTTTGPSPELVAAAIKPRPSDASLPLQGRSKASLAKTAQTGATSTLSAIPELAPALASQPF